MTNLFTKLGLAALLLLMILFIAVGPALAQDDMVVPVELVGDVGWQWWASVVGLLVGVVLVNVGLSVFVNEQVRRWRDEVPAWVLPYVPTIQNQVYSGFDSGVNYLRTRAKQTPTNVDDELVEIIDQQGRKAIVYLFEDADGSVRVAVKGAAHSESYAENEEKTVPF